MRTWRSSLNLVIWWTCWTGLDGEFYNSFVVQHGWLQVPHIPWDFSTNLCEGMFKWLGNLSTTACYDDMSWQHYMHCRPLSIGHDGKSHSLSVHTELYWTLGWFYVRFLIDSSTLMARSLPPLQLIANPSDQFFDSILLTIMIDYRILVPRHTV